MRELITRKIMGSKNAQCNTNWTNLILSNDPGKVDSNFFCFAATVLSPHRNVFVFTQRMHKPT